jgi:hypothetical protein
MTHYSWTQGIELEELYDTLMIISAHLHVIVRDVHDSTRFCPSENFAKLKKNAVAVRKHFSFFPFQNEN